MKDVLINSAGVWIDGVQHVPDTYAQQTDMCRSLQTQLAAEKERAEKACTALALVESELDRTREAATWGGMSDAERIARAEYDRDAARRALDEVRGRMAAALESLECTRWVPEGTFAEWEKTREGRNCSFVTAAMGSLRALPAYQDAAELLPERLLAMPDAERTGGRDG